jgi:Rel/ankyrin family protein
MLKLKFLIFLAGFVHRSDPHKFDLNVVRLCFQVYVEGAEPGKCTIPLEPVVSEPIYDKSIFYCLL